MWEEEEEEEELDFHIAYLSIHVSGCTDHSCCSISISIKAKWEKRMGHVTLAWDQTVILSSLFFFSYFHELHDF